MSRRIHASALAAFATVLAFTLACSDATGPGASVPGTPANLALTPIDGGADLAFDAPDDGGSRILRYEYSLDGGSSWISRVPPDTNPALRIVGLSNGVTYALRLRAVNRVGPGEPTAAAALTPAGAPLAPEILAITPGDGTLSVAFAPLDGNGGTITNLEVQLGAGAAWVARSPAGTSSPFVVAGLTNGTAYDLRIRAVSAVGPGAASAATAATPITTPAAVAVGAVSASYRQLSVPFAVTAAADAPVSNIEYSTDGGTTWIPRSPASTSSPLVVSGLADHSNYALQLRAVNAIGAGPATTAAAATTGPGIPAWLSIVADTIETRVCVDSIPTATDYFLRGGSTPTDALGSALSQSTPCRSHATAYGTDRYYRVQACRLTTCSPFSASAVRVISPPITPNFYDLTVMSGNAGIRAWFDATTAASAAAPFTGLRYSVNDGVTWTTLGPEALVPSAPGSALTLDITGLPGGATYTVRLQTINAAGASKASAPLSVFLP